MRTTSQRDAATGPTLALTAREDVLREQARRLVGPRPRRLVAPSDLVAERLGRSESADRGPRHRAIHRLRALLEAKSR